MTAFALSAYPVSGEFRAELAELAGEEVPVVVVPELRRLGPAGLLRRLRGLSGRCLIALEDPTSEPLLPILELLAAASSATTIEVVDRGLRPRRVTRAGAVSAGFGLAAASADGRRALRSARSELDELLAAPRRDAVLGPGRDVLFLNANLWFGVKAGGSIAHVAGVVNALTATGYDVELATAVDPIGVTAAARVTRLCAPHRFGLPPEVNAYRFGRTVVDQLATRAATRFVYQRHSVGSYAGASLSRRLRTPLVLEYNGSEVWVARNWGRPLRYEGLALAAEDASLRHAHVVVTVSDVLRDELVARGVDRERIVTHPNGVDAERFDPARFDDHDRRALRDRYGIPQDAVLATFVGTFGQWHGAEVLAEAVRRTDDARLRFLFVGDGLRAPEVRRLLQGHDSAVLAGLVPQEDAPLHLAASDVLVSPHVGNLDGSPFFGSPTKLFEYLAAGKAIVASDLDQIAEVVRDVGILVRPGDPEELARALADLAGSPDRRADLGARARQRVLERYTWRHQVDAILERVEALR